jgi:hypothetical protein
MLHGSCGNVFFEITHKLVPKKKIKEKSKSLPWLDNVLRKMMTKRDKLFYAWHKIRTASARELYTKARNEVQRALRNAKDEYIHVETGTGPQGSNFFWRFIAARSKVPMNNTTFVEGGKIHSQPQEVASAFSRSFCRKISQLILCRSPSLKKGMHLCHQKRKLRSLNQ